MRRPSSACGASFGKNWRSKSSREAYDFSIEHDYSTIRVRLVPYLCRLPSRWRLQMLA